MAKKKRKFELKIDRTVKTYIWAVVIVVTIPALYLVLFVIKARKEILQRPTTVQGYLNKQTCELESRRTCYEVTTVQEDTYFVPGQ